MSEQQVGHVVKSVSTVEVDKYWQDWITARVIADESGCWIWQRRFDPKGYGAATPKRNGLRVRTSAHRLAYMAFVGRIPEGLELDHLCRNPACANPAHMEPVTHAENMRRARRSHCSRGHELSGYNVTSNGRAGRTCRVCKNASRTRSYHRTKKVGYVIAGTTRVV